MAKKVVEEKKFKLPKGKVVVKPIVKSTFLIPDTNHRAAFLAPGTKNRYVAPLLRNGQYANILTDEEKEYFESTEAGMDFQTGDLSVHKRKDNYWDNFQVELGKDEYTIDKSNPIQYMEYKVLLANTDKIAGSVEDLRLKKKASFDYVLIDHEEAARVSAKEADIEERAWAEFGSVKNDRMKMFMILRVYGLKPSAESSDDFLRDGLKTQLKKDMRTFISTVSDPLLEVKVEIEDAVAAGALLKRAGAYLLPEGDKIGTTLFEAAQFLTKPENQEVYLNIVARIKNSGK